jgi:hypothetical protein
VREEADSAILKHIHREDWHLVERDCLLFDITALELKRDGWTEVPRSAIVDRAPCVPTST